VTRVALVTLVTHLLKWTFFGKMTHCVLVTGQKRPLLRQHLSWRTVDKIDCESHRPDMAVVEEGARRR
jgi:hypothetical protein